ncbi:glycosyltransferase [Marinomonas arenicola]|uniref:glycosyltransferase n=1 Tax=Marinomonas arenicola TaxID=569601 RepID=UPI00311FE051
MNDAVKRCEGGRELIHGAKQGTFDQPLITIITSTYNAAKDLHWTLDSIRSQTYSNIQWIIADGGSKDESVELFKQNEDVIDYWFSEPDKGIYDAWNKALKYAKGDWIQFIGAGDELADSDTLQQVANHLDGAFPTYEIAYGQIEVISEKNRRLIEKIATPWESMRGKWFGIRPVLPVHPEVYHHKSIFKNIDFTQFDIAGDSYIVLSSVLYKDPLYLDFLIDRMPLGGVSTNPKNIIKMYDELLKINDILDIKVPVFIRIKEFLKTYLKFFIMNYFGSKVFFVFGDGFRFIRGKSSKWLVK